MTILHKFIFKIVLFLIRLLNKKLIKQLIKEIYNLSAETSKPKDRFKQLHPNYREFKVDPLSPNKKETESYLPYTEIIKKHNLKTGKKNKTSKTSQK
jgi:hypothetical protein